jgi:hypothetical protein
VNRGSGGSVLDLILPSGGLAVRDSWLLWLTVFVPFLRLFPPCSRNFLIPALASLSFLIILAALVLKAGSLACLTYEVVISGGALRILLNAVEEGRKSQAKSS